MFECLFFVFLRVNLVWFGDLESSDFGKVFNFSELGFFFVKFRNISFILGVMAIFFIVR